MIEQPTLNAHNKEEFPPAHTAEHLLNQTMDRMFHCGRSKNAHIERKKSKINWPLAVAPSDEEVAQIEATINQLIKEDLPITYEYVNRDNIPADVSLEKLPEDASETLRLVRIGDYDAHVSVHTSTAPARSALSASPPLHTQMESSASYLK